MKNVLKSITNEIKAAFPFFSRAEVCRVKNAKRGKFYATGVVMLDGAGVIFNNTGETIHAGQPVYISRECEWPTIKSKYPVLNDMEIRPIGRTTPKTIRLWPYYLAAFVLVVGLIVDGYIRHLEFFGGM